MNEGYSRIDLSSADVEIGTSELADMLDVTAVQSLIDRFNRMTGLQICITDPSGADIVSVGSRDICAQFILKNPELGKLCAESVELFSGIRDGEYRLCKCNGIWNAATPITIRAQHVGTLIMGQFFFDDEEVDEAAFRDQARRFGFDEREYLAALAAVPRIGRETIAPTMEFLMELANTISQLSYNRVRLARSLAERVRLMDSLREREEIYSAIARQASDGIVLLDAQTLHFVEFNDAACDGYGYTREEFARITLADLVPNASREEVAAMIRDQVRTGRLEYESKRRHKSGRLLDFNIHTHLLRLNGRDYMAAVWRDITERKQAESALRDSEAKFRSYIEHAPLAVFVFDSTAHYVEHNQAALDLVGYNAEEAKDLNLLDLLSDKDRERGMRDFALLLELGAIAGEYEIRAHDGALLSLMLRIVKVAENRYLGFASDITARKRSEQALRDSEEKYRGLFESTLDGIIIGAGTGRIIAANPAACAMFGMSEEEICARGRDGLLDPDDPKNAAALDNRVSPGRATYEQTYVRRDGTRFPAETTRVVMNGGAWSFVMLHDITNRKAAEEERDKLQAQLLHSQKMEAIGQLAGGVAHDFNNLLTVILGYSEMLLAKLAADDPNRSFVADIFESGERAASLTRQLLAFSRKQILAPRVVNINTIISGVEKMLRRLIGEDVILATELCETVQPVEVDSTQLEQVVINLAVNARDAMSQGGQLFIETENCVIADGEIRLHPAIKPGEYAVISMTDTGCGMSEEVRSKIFEPFFTTKEQGRGTGLGLATVFGIVKQSGGYIDVMSTPGAGSCFKIFLPFLSQEADKARNSASDNGKAPFGGESILLIEDEEAVRGIARLALETHGYRVIEAAGGKAALAIAADPGERIDLLVTDVIMPEMSGPELVARVQSIRPGLKVLYISGYTDDSIFQRGLTRGSAGYLQKPFAPVTLARRVRRILDAGE